MASRRNDACALADAAVARTGGDLVAAIDEVEADEGLELQAVVLAVLRDRRDHLDPFDGFPS